MVWEVVTCKWANARSIFYCVAIEAALILVVCHSFVIDSHVRTCGVNINSVRGSGSRKRVVIVVKLKTWIFTPTPTWPTIIVAMCVLLAFTAFSCGKSWIRCGIHSCYRGAWTTCDDLASFTFCFFTPYCFCIRDSRLTSALVNCATYELIKISCVNPIQNHAGGTIHSVVEWHSVFLCDLIMVCSVNWRRTSLTPPGNCV